MKPILDKSYLLRQHVYAKGKKVYRAPDNDNYEFKRVVDILTDYIGGGDGAFTTRYVLESVKTDDIPEGSYILVVPKGTIGILRTEDIRKEIKQKFLP